MLRFWPLLFWLLALGSWNTYTPGDTNDDTSYLALARSLSQGQPYLDLAFVGHPPHQRFPPGYPLLLLPLQWIWPHNYDVCRLQGLVFAGLAAWAMMAYARRLAEELPGVWRWAPLLALFNPFWLFHTTQIMSEQPFLIGFFACLWFWDQLVRVEQPTFRRFFYFGMALGILTIVRVVAVFLLAVMVLQAIWRWRWRCFQMLPPLLLGFALTAGPCLLRTVLTGYDNQADAALSHPWLTFRENLQYFPCTAGLLMVTGFRWLPDWLPLWSGLVPFTLGLCGLWGMRARPLLLGWVLAGVGMLLGWPFTHPRLLLPFLPFLQLGLWFQLGAVRRPLIRVAFWSLVLVNLVGSALDGWQAIPVAKDAGLLALLRTQTSETVLSARDQSWWLWTDLPMNSVQQMQAVEREWIWLQDICDSQVTLLVVERLQEADSQALLRHLQRRGWLYQEVSRSPNGVIFRFQPEAAWRESFRWQRLARNALSMRRFDWASQLFQRALKVEPYDISAASGLAYTLAAQGRMQEAAQLAKAVLAADPECGEALRVQGFVVSR
ncbi:MAG: hypothetical protein KF760_16910 [Candidatus Eremiobacteraeota bacterium]|nr:hypothetical protein [Candidatus Eremiobacteraeota bacterium]MCW5866528.1 hypothetical protein [Candidatus Eremiobacteraeota bacterium]